MSSTNVNSTSNVPTSALLYSLMSDVNNNLSNKFINVANKGYTQLSQFMDSGLWNQPFVFEIPYSSTLAPDQNNIVGVAERGMLHAFSNSGKYFYCVDSSKGWQESPYVLKSDLFGELCTNPNTLTASVAMVNGYDSNVTNIPDAAKKKFSVIQNVWASPSDMGDLTKTHMQVLIIGNGGVVTRKHESNAWSNWQ